MKTNVSLFPFLTALLILLPSPASAQAAAEATILVFSKTDGYRHASIPVGVEAIERLGREHGFDVGATEDAAAFTDHNLARYAAVVFLNTSGDVLDDAQQAAFEAYVRQGGGFAGIHGAAATEYDWPWYGRLVGAFFDDHPEPQTADVLVFDRVHPSTGHLPSRLTRFDEWYNFRSNPRGSVHVLAALDEKSYEGGSMGHDHPIAWAHEFDGGRAWYTGLGHTMESYSDSLFLKHVLGGIRWAAGLVEGDAAATRSSSFEKVVLEDELTDPMEIGIAPDGKVFLAERSGPIKMWDPSTGRTRMVGYIPVRMTIEDGLLGLTLDPHFDENGWIYVYYAPADGGPQRLARLTFDGTDIQSSSEKILFEIKTQQEECCHSAGSLAFGPDGTLYLATGDNTNPYPLGGSSIDERPDKREGDAQRTSANTNDLRGKILRIRPLPEGTYEIPGGNLFDGDSLHRPEIYVMGNRNPYRISVDPETGWLYWGDVGIGNPPSADRGPWGWEEFNQARVPGFYGWPYFAGPNEAYRKFDYETQTPGAYFDPDHPINDSPNNTGARELPPSQPALIWYTYGPSHEFPALGAGGMSAMGGPVYRYDAETASPHALPAYYDGAWLIYEWMRNWILEARLDENGDLVAINPFLPEHTFVRPTDVEVGPDGRLYVLEWGQDFWGSNRDARLVRMDYHGSSMQPEDAETARDDSMDAARRGGRRSSGADGEASGAEGPPLSFAWPPEGGVYTYGSPVAYRVVVDDQDHADAPVTVRTYVGHDTHVHPLDRLSGSMGAFEPQRAFEHVPPIYYMDEFYVLTAEMATEDPVAEPQRITLQPRRKEAEHFAVNEGADRATYGKHPAEPDFADAAMTTMMLTDGAHLAYAPLHFANVDSIRLRVKAHEETAIEFRLDAPDGPVMAEIAIDSTAVLPQSARGDTSAASSAGALPDLALTEIPDDVRGAYEGWKEWAVSIEDPGGTRSLYLIARGKKSGRLLEVDWIEFTGQGISRNP